MRSVDQGKAVSCMCGRCEGNGESKHPNFPGWCWTEDATPCAGRLRAGKCVPALSHHRQWVHRGRDGHDGEEPASGRGNSVRPTGRTSAWTAIAFLRGPYRPKAPKQEEVVRDLERARYDEWQSSQSR